MAGVDPGVFSYFTCTAANSTYLLVTAVLNDESGCSAFEDAFSGGPPGMGQSGTYSGAV
jgi:hypothetical protein